MTKKDIEKLFPSPPIGSAPDPGEEPTIVWYGKAMYMERRGFVFGKDAVIRAQSGSTAGYARGTLSINGRETPCSIGPRCWGLLDEVGLEYRSAYALRAIGNPGAPLGALIRFRNGQGTVWVTSGRQLDLRSGNHRPVLSENGRVAVRHLEAWTDADAAAGIGSRTWLVPDLQGEEAIVVAALLVLNA